MIESLIQKVIYELDFIDLNILEQLINNDYFIAFPILVKRLQKVNVCNRGIVRRRIERLREFKLIHFEDGRSPMVIESYLHRDKEIMIMKEALSRRLIRY